MPKHNKTTNKTSKTIPQVLATFPLHIKALSQKNSAFFSNTIPFKKASLLLATLSLTGFISQNSLMAQTITPAADGTGTIVTPDGQRIDINGGTLSNDKSNLFHSFQKFNLDQNHIANFLSNPSIRNILGRVTGGDPSIINGLIQVSGGNSNLYLMNPAGIVFGANATLNVPAAFNATTANGIRFGNDWFSARGINNYSALGADPNAYAFTTQNLGSIVNAGNLAVGSGQKLSLVGGTVVNTGQIAAPGGQIIIAGVESQNLVRISAPGNVLNLEIQPISTSTKAPNNWTSAIASLPQLLTGSGDIGNATKMKVTQSGNVVLSGSGLSVPNGNGIAIASGTIDASHTAAGKTGGSVGVVGDKVAVDAAAISATGSIGGGNILIGGEYQGKGTLPTASRTYVSKDSGLVADAVVSGNGGKVIVWADEVTGFYGNISAHSGSVAGDGGFVEVSGKDKLAFHGQVDVSAVNGKDGTLLLDPRNITIVATGAADDNQLDANVPNPNDLPGLILSGDGGAVDFTLSRVQVENQAGNVVIEATNDITIAPGVSLLFGGPGGSSLLSIEFKADADGDLAGSFSMDTTQSIVTDASPVKISGASVKVGSINTGFYGNAGAAITLNATNGNITTGNLSSRSAPVSAAAANGGDITLSATGNISTGSINSFSSSGGPTNSAGGNGGAIKLDAANGSITTGAINSYSSATSNNSGNGGAIALTAANGITIQGNLNSRAETSYASAGSGGEIKLITSNGSITAGDITSSSSASNSYVGGSSSTGGNITLTNSNGSITAGSINSSSSSSASSNGSTSSSKTGGNIAITTSNGSITTASLNSSSSSSATGRNASSSSGNGGAIAFSGATDITINGDISSYSSGGDGNGGDISLSGANEINITTDVGIISYSSGGTGKGGAIDVAGKNITINTEFISATGQTGSGNISLTGDEINFTGATSIQGKGKLVLQPFTPSQDINFAGTDSGSTAILDLTKTELDYFQPGFTSINIGRPDGTGIITLNPYNFSVQVNIAGGSTLVGPNQDTTWNITGADGGNITGFPNGLTFNSIENLTGGTLNDTFIFTVTANISGKIDGAAGFDILNYAAHTTPVTVNLATGAVNIESVIGSQNIDTIIGPDTNNNWNITQIDSGNVNGNISFSSFENLTGGIGNDTFIFSNGAFISGKIDGNTGIDTLDYSAYTTAIALNLATDALNIENIIGTQNIDTIIGADTNNNWDITGKDAGSANNTLNFSSFENLIGGKLNDTFTFNSGALISGNIDGLAGNDTIIGPNTDTKWNITAKDAGNAVGISNFSSIENLNAGSANDTFIFSNDANISGKIDGNAGSDTLDYSASAVPLTLNLGTGAINGALNIENIIGTQNIDTIIGADTNNNWNITAKDAGSVNKTLNFSSFENLTGGTLNDTFTFSNGALISGKIDGNTGSDTIVGANTDTKWNITAKDAGNAPGISNFSSIENLNAGSANDTFIFSNDANISGKIDGNAGSDTLDYSASAVPLTLNLGTGAINGALNIENIIGTQNIDTIIGADTNNNWNITGNAGGNVNGTLNFSSFENLTGGSQSDTFTFNSGAIANMVVDASLGNDAIIVNGPTTLTGKVSLSTGADGGDINFNNTLDGSASLTLAAGKGNINFSGAVGSNTRLGNLVIDSANNVTTGAIAAAKITQLSGSGTTTFNGKLDVTGDIKLAGNNFTFNSPVTTTNGGGITVNNSGLLNINDAADMILNAAFSQSGAGAVSTAGDILANGSITFDKPVTLAGNVFLNSSAINFKNGIDGNFSLKLAAGTGDINFGGAVGNNTRLGALVIDSAGNVTGGAITASSIAQKAGFGTTTFNGTLDINGAGGINLNGNNFALNGSASAPNVTVQATNNITTNNITANGGINLRSSGGDINTRAGNLDASSKKGNGGAIALEAKNNVIAGNIDSHSDNGNGGKIELQSQTGILAGGNLTTTGTARGGDIVVKAKVSINAGKIDSSSSFGDAGNVFLDPENDIDVKFINAGGGTDGKGGNVDIITQRFFRASETYTNGSCVSASICTSGARGDGSITINHGGSKLIPFKVGDASINGTLGVISSGNNAISPQQSVLGSYTQGNIKLVTNYSPPTPPQPTPPTPSNQIITALIQQNPSPQTETQTSTPSVTIDRVVSGSTSVEATLAAVEGNFTNEFTQYLGLTTQNVSSAVTGDSQNSTQANNSGGESGQSKNSTNATLNDAVDTLRKAESSTGIKPALIYIVFQPETINQQSSTTTPQATVEKKKFLSSLEQQPLWQFNSQNLPVPNQYLAQAQTPNTPKPQPNDKLQLILVTSSGKPILKTIPGATREQVMAMANKLRSTITKRDDENKTSYLKPAEQLYKWTVANLETELKEQKIGNLVFVLDAGLRSLPMAALHDGKGFLIERYSIGLMPSLSLVDTRYVDIKQAQVLGMGASKFNDASQNPLPAAQEEVSLVTNQLWKGKSFMNEDFTLARLKSERSSTPFGIIHLATHGEFKPGKPGNSYIQLWDKKLGLDEMRQLGWNNPPVQLLVLSACRTALGDAEAELGFAGLAVQAGVQTAVASLWYVSDEGSLGLMSDFYRQLKKSPTKAEALRRAQLALLKGEVRLEGGKLHGSGENLSLPPELVQLGDKNLSHPYYWAAFTMIGSPW